MKTKFTFSAVGDMLIQRRIPCEYDGFQEVKLEICKADARFFNLETTINNGEFYGNQFNGGSYLRANPEVLEDAKNFGFNMLSFANNHAMDFDRNGLLATKDYVDKAGFVNSGAGSNLDEASSPAYLDLPHGRVALISLNASMVNDAALAGRQSRRYMGRPGVNGLRAEEYLTVTEEQLKIIKEIGEQSQINARADISIAEGYTPPRPDDVAVLKNLKFKIGNETKFVTLPNREDMERTKKMIYEAQMQADYIIISIHSHDVSGSDKENAPELIINFAHECIDAGAHAVIGHGPHLLRPVEIYKKRPIFYSLGDFVIHNECIPFLPEDSFSEQKLTSDATMREFFAKRSKNYTRGLMRDHRMLESVVAYFEMENGELTHLEFMPLELSFNKPVWQSGNPKFDAECGIIERLAEMSKKHNCIIDIDERGYGVVRL